MPMKAPLASWASLVAASAAPPMVWRLETAGALPLALRDHPWLVGGTVLVVAIALAMTALHRGSVLQRRTTVALLVSALASGALFGWLSSLPYTLPASSPGADVGGALPSITLTDESGRAVELSTLRGRPTLLVWFAGSWCPFCRHQLTRLAQIAPEYAGAVRIVAVTADPPEELRTLRQELNLPFSILSDPTRILMRRCELMHCVSVLDTTGTIRWGIVSGNWRDDLNERAFLHAAYALR